MTRPPTPILLSCVCACLVCAPSVANAQDISPPLACDAPCFTAREIAFTGVSGRSLDLVREAFGLTENTPVGATQLASAVARITADYRAHGFPDVRVETTWRPTDDPAVAVLIVALNEGAVTLVRHVRTDGLPGGVDVEGAVREVLAYGDGDPADPVIAARVPERIVLALRRAGYFGASCEPVHYEPVEPARGGHRRVDAVFRVHAGDHYAIAWQGTATFNDRELEGALRITDESRIDATTLGVLATRVRAFYVRRAFLDARVRVDLREVRPGGSRLDFQVDEGEQLFVQSVRFDGAQAISPARLREVLDGVLYEELPGGQLLQEPGEHVSAVIGGAVTGDEDQRARRRSTRGHVRLSPENTYVPELYDEALRRLLVRYRDAGFLEAAVTRPDVVRVVGFEGHPALEVRFRVTEGVRTMLDEAVFTHQRSFSSHQLADALTLQLGLPLSYTALENARVALTEFYREKGYLFVRVTPSIDRSPDRSLARARFDIDEGPLVRVGQIRIRGNDHTNAAVILSRVTFRTGDIYLPHHARTTQRLLGELGIFGGVSVLPGDPEHPSAVQDVVVQVLELRPQYLELRGGASTAEGLRIGFDYGYRNLGGSGLTFTTGAQIGYNPLLNLPSIGDHLRYRIALALQVPAFPGLPPTVRGSVDLSLQRVLEGTVPEGAEVTTPAQGFAIDSQTASVSGVWRPFSIVTFTLTPEIQRATLQLFGADGINQRLMLAMESSGAGEVERLRRLLLLPQGTTTLTALRVTAAIDLRDQVFNPTRGFFATVTGEIVHTLDYQRPQMFDSGTDPVPGDTLRGIASVSGYIPIVVPVVGTLVFASNLRGGVNFRLTSCDTVTYPNRLFFLGGADSMRGWLQDTIIPQDVIDGRPDNSCSGQSLTVSQSMASYAQRGGDAFVNWRNELRVPIGTTGFGLGLFVDIGNLWRNGANVNLLRLRAAAGLGLRYVTPIGPVAIDYGWILDPQAAANEFPGSGALNFSVGLF